MGGPSTAATAYASSPRPSAISANDRRQRLDAAVHSLRKTTQQYGVGANSSDRDHKHEHQEHQADSNNSENDGFLSDSYADEDGNDDYEDFNEEEVRAAAALEHKEMKRHFNFQLEKRRSLKNHFMSAMHKKRRLLMRNENLRFRELYKAPEPIVLLIVVSIVTIVTLILTKSWPFYSDES